jgi:hypothetical protein
MILICLESEFLCFDSLTVACAVMAAARNSVKIKDLWRKELVELTSVKEKDFNKCYTILKE